MSILDRLTAAPEPPEGGEGGGLKASYLLDLPPDQRRVMRVLLRHTELTLAELARAIESLPESERISPEQLEKVLAVLVEQNWVIRAELNAALKFKANFQRKSENALEKAPPKRRVSPVVKGVWDALEAESSAPEKSSKPKGS